MKITKLGHCCLIIDIRGVRFLTDPGNYTTVQDEVTNIQYVVITHEHTDHLHIESLKKVLKNNPQAKVITNESVGKILTKEGIPFTKVSHGKMTTASGVPVAGYGTVHAYIYKDYEQVENTGYLFDNKFFISGDSFYVPKVPVEILAYPVGAPWANIAQSIDYVLEVKPRVAFGVHDGNLIKTTGLVKRLPEIYLEKAGIKAVYLELGKETEF
jgi:L-ascorbate metabolism protein UlaG (beta-lactamase superfamily)